MRQLLERVGSNSARGRFGSVQVRFGITMLLAIATLGCVKTESLALGFSKGELQSEISTARGINENTTQESVSVQKIWAGGAHNAFTDLIRFDGYLVCAFREANSHVPKNSKGNGKIRLIRSKDGIEWESWKLFARDGVDLRDPKLSKTSDGRLMILAGGSVYRDGQLLERIPAAYFCDIDGMRFTEHQSLKIDPEIASKNDWLWRVTWHEGHAYGVVYQANKKKWGLHLVRSENGIEYDLVSTLHVDGRPNEATLRFAKDGTMVIVVRNEDGKNQSSIGTSKAPYQKWSWTTLYTRLGGPDLELLDDKRWVLGTRSYDKNPTTVLAAVTTRGFYRPFLTLPSGGDTSYPGILVEQETVWVSYYSSHEGKSNIYLYKSNKDELGTMHDRAMNPALEAFTKKKFVGSNGNTLPYRLMKPENIESKKTYPLVVFLHGAGERGSDNTAQLVHGMDDFASPAFRQRFPAFVLAPQCPQEERWVEVDWSAERHNAPVDPGKTMAAAIELIEQTIKEHPVDTNRIYVTGLSMGGFGTWDLMARRPELFAAAMPICGGGDTRPAFVSKIKHIPTWVIHGDKDTVVRYQRSKEMVEALQRAGGKPKFTTRKNVGHNSWTDTYRDPTFIQWMFAQKKK